MPDEMDQRTPPLITLLTDFGESDGYVAQMEGVILGINPEARIVSVSHQVPAQDIRSGARLLADVIGAFPPGTIHVAVVDPGVGSERRLVGVEMADQRFVAPDNGLLGEIASRFPPHRIHLLSAARFHRPHVSNTFHGRDVLAPAAAHWSCGRDLSELGPALSGSLVWTPAGKPAIVTATKHPEGRAGREIVGEIEWVDHFGNLVTNIPAAELPVHSGTHVRICLNGATVDRVSAYYAEVPHGELLALIGSSGRLEIAVNGGSAAARLHCGCGTEVRVAF